MTDIDVNTAIVVLSMFINSGILLGYFGSIEKRLCRIENIIIGSGNSGK